MKSIIRRAKRNLRHYRHSARLLSQGAYREKTSVSLCTTTKNRFDHLKKTVTKNVLDNQHYAELEILILNYNCPDPRTDTWVRQELSGLIEAGIVSYYFFPDSLTFNYAHSRNMALRLARGDILCNVDADNYTGKGFANYLSAFMHDRHTFVAGPRDGRGLGGRIAVMRDHFDRVGGYDERIVDWGGLDYEFCSRLEASGLNRRVICNESYLKSISHSDALRTQYSNYADKWETQEINQQIYHQNLNDKVLNPNGSRYGCGKVQYNFGQWLTIK